MIKKQYKNISLTILLMAISLLGVITLPGCGNGLQQIPEDELQEIITEAMITSAILTQQNVNAVDSIDPYKAILQKYGYTLRDYVYTIDYMSGRKSNPLTQIFKSISAQMTVISHQADFDYKRKLRYDSAVVAFTQDTVLTIDTTIKGKLNKYDFVYLNPKIGEYELQFKYRSMGSYDYGTKLLKLKHHDASISHNKSKSSSYWMDITYQPKDYSKKFKITTSTVDSLKFSFVEPSRRKGVAYHRDTSYIQNIKLIYYPPIEQARQTYFKAKTDFPLEIKPYTIDNDLTTTFQPLDSSITIVR